MLSEQELFHAKHRIVEPEPGTTIVTDHFLGIAKELLPHHDWQNQPFKFYVSDSPVINAYILPGMDPPSIVVTKQLIEFLKYKAEAALVTGHELGHKDFRNRYKVVYNSNPEEISADRFAIDRMAEANYSWRGAVSFFQRLLVKKGDLVAEQKLTPSVLLELLIKSVDEHLSGEDRIKFFTTLSGGTSLTTGKPLPDPPLEPFPEDIKAAARNLRHVSPFEKICSLSAFATKTTDEQFRILEELARHPVLAKGYDSTVQEFCQYVEKLVIDWKVPLHPSQIHIAMRAMVDPKKEDRTAQLHQLMRLIWDHLPDVPAAQEKIYLHISGFMKENKYDKNPPLGYFYDLDQAIQKFAAAQTAKDAEDHARIVCALIDKLNSHFFDPSAIYGLKNMGVEKTSLGGYVRIQSFSEAIIQEQYRLNIPPDNNPPHSQHLGFVSEETPHVAKALWLLGVNKDRNLWQRLGDDALMTLGLVRSIFSLPDTWQHLSARWDEFGEYSDLDLNYPRNRIMTSIKGYIGDRKFGNTIPFRGSEEEWKAYMERARPTLDLKNGDDEKKREFVVQLTAELKKSPTADIVLRTTSFFHELINPYINTWDRRFMPTDDPYFTFLAEHSAIPQFKSVLQRLPQLVVAHSINNEDFLAPLRKVFDIPKPTTIRQLERNLEIWSELQCVPRAEFQAYIESVPFINISEKEGQKFILLLEKHKSIFTNSATDTVDRIREKLWAREFLDQYTVEPKKLPKENFDLFKYYLCLEEFSLFPNEKYREDLAKRAVQALIKAPPSPDRDELLEKSVLFRESAKPLHPEVTKAAIDAFVAEKIAHFVEDDKTGSFYSEFMYFVDQLLGQNWEMHNRYRMAMTLLDKITKGISAQPELCKRITKLLDERNAASMEIYNLYVIGIKTIIEAAKKDEEIRLGCIDFLSLPLSKDSLEKVMGLARKNKELLQTIQSDQRRYTHFSQPQQAWGDIHDTLVLTTYFSDMHRKFWDLDSRERIVIMDNLLIPSSELIKGQEAADAAFKKAFDLVSTRLFPAGSIDNALAVDFVHHFLDQAREEERGLLLAGLMAANRQSETGSRMGQKLRIVFSVMGPSYVKLGQQLGSFLSTRPEPEARQMAADLEGLKSEAQSETLWDYYPRLFRTLPKELAGRIIRFMHEQGSASINKVFKIATRGTDGRVERKALLLERENALPLANAGFDHILRTVQACEHPFWKEHRETASGIVEETRKTFSNEVDIKVFGQQLENSQEIYDGRTLSVRQGVRRFKVLLKPVHADSYGMDKNGVGFKIMDNADGVHFKELPENTARERAAKKALAKAYATFELTRILSGKVFDSDRHGSQMRILVDGNHIIATLFDFGCMMVTPPDATQRKQLADAILYIAKGQLNKLHGGRPVSNDPRQALTHYINEREKAGADASFLRTARRGIVALGDFFSQIPSEDIPQIFEAALREARNPLVTKNLIGLATQGKGVIAKTKTYAGWLIKSVLRNPVEWYQVHTKRSTDQKIPPVIYIGEEHASETAAHRTNTSTAQPEFALALT